MNRFKRILVILEDSGNQHALERGFDLAKRNEAQLTLIKPIGPVEQSIALFKDLPWFSELRSRAIAAYTSELETIRNSRPDHDIPVDILTPGGTPFIEVIKEVLRNDHDLVITTASTQPGKLGGVFHSTALHLIRKCPCPVWVIAPHKRGGYGRILAAVDPRVLGVCEDSLNVLIMDLATSLAQMDDSKLHVVHAYNSVTFGGHELFGSDSRDQTFRQEVQRCVDASVDNRKSQLDTLLKGYPLERIPHEVHFVEGNPDRVVPSLAMDREVGLIVMGTTSKGHAAGHWIGCTAENIIMQVGCSVLTVKPEGFVSPVQLSGKKSPRSREPVSSAQQY